MSGRGARGRKAIVKNIEKTEKKQAAKQYSHDIRSTTSSSGWSLGSSSTLQRPSSSQTLTRTPSFSTTIRSQGSSSNSRNASQSRNEQHRPKTAAAKIKPDERYQNRAGKETVAPRGRGGGVPSKSTPANRVGQPSQMSDRTTQSTSDVSQSRRTSGMMFWYGGDKSPVPYRGFDNDHDMRMSSGDCNVYFSEEVDDEDPKPALRVHVKLLERAGSLFLNNLLQYGEVYRVDELTPPPTPGAPLTRSNLGYLAEETETPASFSSDNGSSISQYPRNYANNSLRPSGSRTSNHQAMRGMNEATPPMSAAASDKASSAGMYGQEAEITHEIWFRAPANITSSFEKHLYHLAVRNFLALLYTLPVVGRDVFEMFSGLLGVMDSFYELNEGDPRRRGNVQRIIEYIRQRGLDDVRGNSRAALGLLAWCELPHVRWLEGYKEAFIHSVGIMNSNMQDYPEFKRLSLTTRHNLENAYNQLQLKVLDAERLLENWNFSDIWTTMGISESHAAYKSYDLFRKFLVDYYSNDCGAWPPERSTNSGRWLNRSVVTRLQEDFGAMWEYLVDRNIYWQANETRHTRKWEIMPYKNHSGESFNADMPGLPITDMLGSFDNRNMHERLPGPYPLLPRSTHIPAPKQKEKKSFFGGLRGKAKSAAVRDQKEQFEIAIAFSGATNNNKPGLTFECKHFSLMCTSKLMLTYSSKCLRRRIY
ncbi:hypothetical protein M501DRAFT_215665 [Patellaria atrata CBS 101060]|uniref:DUF8004 domain-containing protein n=1 Tax=Patellaria atrata CBS 101060 TaxID=1346257 RepID=A0A9P4VPS1_9PEZI|nr:hypothetical protein M501DRAFT_215665 [Patellaria atrata CBS 101060]